MYLKKLINAWPGKVISLLAGASLTLAFSPFSIFPFAVISPAILLACWLNVSAERAFARGLLFGIGFFGTGVSWVFISIHHFGNAPMWLAGLITTLFVLILALFPAINGYLFNRFFPIVNVTKILCAFPLLWVFFEWLRSWLFTGFPWLYLGYSQINSPLRGYAPVLGVYGVSLVILFSSSLLIIALSALIHLKRKKAYFCLIGLSIIWIAGSILSGINWTKPLGKPIQVSLIQGNIPQEMKWVEEHAEATLDLYQHLSEQHWDSQLIIWPEAAIPMPLQQSRIFIDHVAAEASQHHTAIITGIPVKAPFKEGYYNAAITLGTGKGFYFKSHLVPFGEFTPFEQHLGKLLTFFDIPMSNITTEPGKPPAIMVNNIKIATFICYEIAFPEQVRSRDGAIGVILTITDDAWFGHSIAQAQHLEIARMRALETGRPLLFVSNDGITAFISPTGKIQSAAPAYTQYVLTNMLQPTQGETPWNHYGIDPVLLLLTALLVVAISCRKVKK